jgi:hypothetical protein
MKLRLGLLNKDLAKRFEISEALCSRIFFSWLRAASKALRHLIFIPDQETLVATKPEVQKLARFTFNYRLHRNFHRNTNGLVFAECIMVGL